MKPLAPSKNLSIVFLALFTALTPIQAADAPASIDLKADLPRIPATEPADALKTFQVAPGFRLEQVAAEPQVNSPVAMAFDEDSRLYVVEMRGYSGERDAPRVSRVRLLTDTDEDGRYDQDSIFVDGLLWPTAVGCWDGGVFVGDAPDVWYFKDIDGDGRADVRRKVYTGFGDHNRDGLMNTFTWTLDNRIEIATSSSGGEVFRLAEDGAVPKGTQGRSIRGRNMAFEPRTLEFELTSGALQHGMTFDDWGHKFLCGNSNPIQQVMYEDRYLSRSPYVVAPPARIDIVEGGAKADVFRISPVEPWRVARTKMRVSGAIRGSIEGGGTPAGYFTSGSGVTLYRGTALPKDAYNTAFIGEVAGNLVHRRRLVENGLEFLARPIDDHKEFLASTDNWFRPAQFANAPDGALYLADVYREVVENPFSIPDDIKKHLDLTSGIDRGRLYRIVGEGFKQPKLPKLSKATTAELVDLLEHPNAWHRSTASRLLYERRDEAAIEPLRKMALSGTNPIGQMQAMYALDGLGKLDEAIVLKGLEHKHPRVREHAVRLSERLGKPSADVGSRLYAMADDDDLGVRYQLAFTLGMMPADSARNNALLKIARGDGENRWVNFALLVSMSAGGAGPMFEQLIADESFRTSTSGKGILAGLASAMGQGGTRADQAFEALSKADASLAATLLRGYADGVLRSGRSPRAILTASDSPQLAKLTTKLVAEAQANAGNAKLSSAARLRAIRALPLAEFADVRDLLASLLDQRQPQPVQLAALASLDKFKDPGVVSTVLASWPALGPGSRAAAAEVLLGRQDRIVALLDAIDQGAFSPRDLELPRLQMVARNKDPQVRERAEKVLATINVGRRQDVIEAYKPVLALTGDAERGRQVFRKTCVACHKLEGVGTELAPNLAAVKARGAEFILFNVLDPSREVNPQYVNYVLITDDGRSMTGMIASETATSVTLRRAEGATDTVPRDNIEQLQSTGLSLMPEGLEQQVDRQAMADLIAYLLKVQ
jgi:putative membrane-bound dehydrogenase-like protein